MQIEGAFVQGLGFFMFEEYLANSEGLVVTEGTWTYKIPSMDTIPKQFNVEILNSGHHEKRVLSSKGTYVSSIFWVTYTTSNKLFSIVYWTELTRYPNFVSLVFKQAFDNNQTEMSSYCAASGEPPLVLAVSVHCATRAAIEEARKQLLSWSSQDGSQSIFQLDVPATMPVVKELCGLDIVDKYLEWSISKQWKSSMMWSHKWFWVNPHWIISGF